MLDPGVVGDVRPKIKALLPLLQTKSERRHLDNALERYKRARRTGCPGHGHTRPQAKPIHPQYLAKVISEQAVDDAIFTADVGLPTVWAARYLKMNGRLRLIGLWMRGSMANAMPHALGAQAAQAGRQVISLSGDGRFTMLMGDLITLTQMKLPVKVVIFNNGVLGFVALEMKAAGFVEHQCRPRKSRFRSDGAGDGRRCAAGRGPGRTA